MSKQLEVLLRKNKGKSKQVAYKQIFLNGGIPESELVHVSLEESDAILEKVSQVFVKVEALTETVKALENSSSRVLQNLYYKLGDADRCFVYTTDVEFCGMFHTKTALVLPCALRLVRLDYQNLLFIIDEKFRYFLSVHFNDKSHINEPLTFDVQIKEVQPEAVK